MGRATLLCGLFAANRALIFEIIDEIGCWFSVGQVSAKRRAPPGGWGWINATRGESVEVVLRKTKKVKRIAAMTWCAMWGAPSAALEVADLCDGRYVGAAEVLDAAYTKYGTLYSGGDHWHRRDNVGATIDVYRLLNNQTDLGFRDVDRMRVGWPDDPLREAESEFANHDRFAGLLPLGNPSGGLSEADKYLVATLGDLTTTLGPAPGWWITQLQRSDLSPAERRTSELVQQYPLVEWLQFIQAASNAPWAYNWYFADSQRSDFSAYSDLANESLAKFDDHGEFAWLAAAAVLAPGGEVNLPDLSDLQVAVDECLATPAGYAAHAVLRLAALRHGADIFQADRGYLPDAMYRVAFRNEARLRVQRGDGQTLDDLVPLAPDAESLSWLNVARTYHAETLDELIAIHRATALDIRSVRALNVLSVAHLLQFAETLGYDPQAQAQMYGTAFARLVALGRLTEAEALVPQLRTAFPDQDAALEQIMQRSWPLDVQLALVVLALPDGSVWLTQLSEYPPLGGDTDALIRGRTKYGINLPLEMRTAAFLDRDLEVWLQVPGRWGAFAGMRGYSVGSMDRAYDRGVRPVWWGRIPVIVPDRPRAVLGFSGLIAWDEITLLGPDHGLSRRVSLSLLRWAEQSPENRFLRSFGPDVEMADGLRRVVLLGQQNELGTIGGVPVAQTAFELLHTKFAGSDAAGATEYWYDCSARCER